MSTILVLAGSPSTVSRTTALAQHVAAELSAYGHDATVLNLRDLPAAALLGADASDPDIAAAVQSVLSADAIIVATPVYKASYSGLLKTFLDLLPQSALLDKVVLPLATGGTIAHVLSIDYALRPVLQSLGASHVTAGRFVLDTTIDPQSGGPVLADEATRDCIDRTIETFRAALTLAATTQRQDIFAAPVPS